MNWKDSNIELPKVKNNQGARCLGYCHITEKERDSVSLECFWKGYIDVFFHPTVGWKRCENEEQICVLKWIYIEDLEND